MNERIVMMKMKVGILLMAVAVTANTEVVLANDDASETQKKTANAPAGPQVPVAVAVSRNIIPSAEFTGSLAAIKTVELRPRVGGNVINLSCSPAQGKPPEAASRHGRRAMTRPLPLNQAV
ncbi:TPA: hypothetical protein NJR17_006410 [Pseudomonas aeruginosa]|nr:hypothetical protein [Pseudomonas aeruginosa]HCG2326177.1 hypothetical protein [Pseudomonas aeruginosa]